MASSSQPPSSLPKRQKLSLLEEDDDVDRISDLPDCLLCHILSFLPTIEAVATSILSSRWKTLWTFVPCLYLDYNLTEMSSSPYVVSRIIAQHKAPHLRKFLLHADWSCDAFHADTWVRASISPNLEELELYIYVCSESEEYNYNDEMFDLPRSIFSCKNLVVLKLRGKIVLNLPYSFKLPSLKILHLYLQWANDDFDWRLLSGCPVLEDLVLERDGGLLIERDGGGGLLIGREDYDEVLKIKICVPTLKRLKFSFRLLDFEHPDYKLEINAPALEYFNFIGDLRQVVFLKKLPNLVEAYVDIDAFYFYGEKDDPDYGDRVYYANKVLGLLREFYNVKFLSLSAGTTECLSFAYDHYDLPTFHNLAQLSYEFSCCNWHLLRYLLEQAPKLEVLVVKKDYYDYPSNAHAPVCLKQPLNIPKVLSPHLTTFYRGFKGLKDLSPHLTTFYFKRFQGLQDELLFVRCIMKKARVLKKITFTYGGSYQNVVEEKRRILKKMSNFPSRGGGTFIGRGTIVPLLLYNF